MTKEELKILSKYEVHFKLAKQTYTTLPIQKSDVKAIFNIYSKYFDDFNSKIAKFNEKTYTNSQCYDCLVKVMKGLYEVYFNNKKPLKTKTDEQ